MDGRLSSVSALFPHFKEILPSNVTDVSEVTLGV